MVRGEERKRVALFTKCLAMGASMEQILGVADWRGFVRTADSAFLLAFSSLFSIINPIGGALIFYGFTKDFRSPDRMKVAARVGLYSLLIMFGALWAGTYVLSFFGVSLDALRLGGWDGDRSQRFPALDHERFASGPEKPRAGSHAR